MLVPPFGGRDEVGWSQGYWDLYLKAEEHGGAVHRYLPHYGPLIGYREEVRIASNHAVVGTGWPGIPRESGGRGGV